MSGARQRFTYMQSPGLRIAKGVKWRAYFLQHQECAVGEVLHFHRPQASGFHASKPLNRISDLLHRPHTRVFDGAPRDPRQRVVVNPGAAGYLLPGPASLERLERRNKLFEVHDASLGINALRVKALTPNASEHYSEVESKAPSKTVFQANLRRLIGEQSVNSWAKSLKLEQTTIQRLYDGSDPKLSMIQKIGVALKIEPWKLLVPNLSLKAQPELQRPDGDESKILLAKLEDLERVLNEIKQQAGRGGPRGNSIFGDLDEGGAEQVGGRS